MAAALSVALHLVVLALIVLMGAPGAKYQMKRGEPLFVELPEVPEPAPAGNPAAREPGVREAQPAAPPTPRAERQPPTPAPKPTPPAVASRPPPPAPVGRPAPPVPEPSRPTETPATTAPEAPRAPEGPAPPAVAQPPQPSGPAAPVGPQVASAPPSRDAPPVDIRSALGRGAGAGGQGGGRGGIEGEPIPLDSRDPKYSDYLDRIRRMIKERWGYPCVKNDETRECEYKSAQLVIEFGIAKNGKVPFVNVRRSSGWTIYDDYAVNAIKLASPFPPVPDALSKKGIPILATFNYVVDTSLTNLLR
ncbi:MAG: TonB family protein [Candidatus Rokubacteria bacterium]|nr:TonB family protein [Candidatus Rokubacteria bacterium]